MMGLLLAMQPSTVLSSSFSPLLAWSMHFFSSASHSSAGSACSVWGPAQCLALSFSSGVGSALVSAGFSPAAFS